MFSVIIPTLQRSAMLKPLLQRYSDHPLVDEVIVINNAPAPIAAHEKVRVLDQDENIFVNPAWNLGAREARSEVLVISNDDILFDPALLGWISRILTPRVGIIGPHQSSFGRPRAAAVVTPAYERSFGYGTLMFMSRAHYVPIPADLRVWCGDDFLFHQQRRRNWTFRGWLIDTPMSATVGAPEFEDIRLADWDVYCARYAASPYLDRFGREPRRRWAAGGADRQPGDGGGLPQYHQLKAAWG